MDHRLSYKWSIQRTRMSKISTCCRNPRQDWPALKARWMSSQSRCCFRTTRPEIQSLKLGDKLSFKGFWLTSALSSSLSPPGDTYIGVGKSFKALAKFFALHTFALVVGPRVCGIFSISLKQMTLNCHQSQYHHCSQNHLAPREVGFTVTPSCVVVFASERGHF